jgi:hypothetical protein
MNANPRIVRKPNPVTANPNVKLQSVQIRMMFHATLQSCAPTTNPASNEKSFTQFSQFQKIPMAKQVAQKDERLLTGRKPVWAPLPCKRERTFLEHKSLDDMVM